MTEHIFIISVICVISIIAYKIQTLSKSGAAAATVVGTCIYLGFDVNGLILLGIFFGTSSFWSSFKGNQKKEIEENLEKGSQRDWIQVVANGGVAAIISILYYFTNDLIWVVALITSIASATGDTWSSEIGPLSRREPLSIKNFKAVKKGTSGAISLLGTAAAIVGVCLICLSGFFLLPTTKNIIVISVIFGIIGNAIDTWLGAYHQRMFQCEVCSFETEKPTHCGTEAKKVRGNKWLNNDGVNFLSSLLAPLLAVIIFYFS